LIARSGFELALEDDEPIDNLVVAVADGTPTFEDLRVWFANRIVRL